MSLIEVQTTLRFPSALATRRPAGSSARHRSGVQTSFSWLMHAISLVELLLGLNFLDQSDVTADLVFHLTQERFKALWQAQRWTMAEGRARSFPAPTAPSPTSPWTSSGSPKPNGSLGGANECRLLLKGVRTLIPAHTPV